MKLVEILKKGYETLKENQIPDYSIIARTLLTYTLKKSKIYLIINQEEEIPEKIYKKYNNYIEEIIEGKPLQYITNNQEFMGINFYVDKNVLIPQPDTETLVEKVLEIVQNNYKDQIKILDLCTGSGAIAIALYKNIKIKNKHIYASDISKEALEIARKNATKNKANITLIQSNLLEKIDQRQFDIIVSNPPYIETNTIKKLSIQVQNEPIIALNGGEDGLEFYKEIAKQAKKYIKKGGYLCFEIGYNQAQQVVKILQQEKNYKNIEIIKDLSGKNRCIISKKE